MSEFVCEVAPDEFGELTEVTNLGEEIVRCRDCKWFRENATTNDPSGRYNFCTQHGFDFKENNGFCAWGEKRCDGSTSCS